MIISVSNQNGRLRVYKNIIHNRYDYIDKFQTHDFIICAFCSILGLPFWIH